MSKRVAAFSLVEVVIALAVFSFCLLNILGLLYLGVNSSHDSLQRTTAASIAAEISSDFRVPSITNAAGVTNTPRFNINYAPNSTNSVYFAGDDTSITTNNAVTGNWLYRATVSVGTISTNSYNTIPVRILVTWPGMADANGALAPTNYSGYLDVITAVNTNSP